jgi:AcrR family transcriptional regulator
VNAEPGLRERKKQQTRQLIADAALRLFAERGFDAVPVADVARAADVSEGTVFNYFPRKEDLFYAQMESFEAALIDAVRERGPGESVPEAFARFVLERSVVLAEEARADVIAKAARIVGASPVLQAREREVVELATRSLAELIAEETGAGPGDIEPLVAAHALMGAQRALVAHVRALVLGGARGPRLESDVREQAERAFARLDQGLAGYAVKSSESLT